MKLISVDWLPPFIDSSRGLPRSRVMDQSLRNAGVAGSRVTPIVARVASPDRSGRMNFAPASALRKLRLGRRNRPHEAGQFARHGDTDLVDLHPAATQSGEAAGEPQLRLPGHVADRLRQVLRPAL